MRVTTPLGETATLAIRRPGEAFGELALVSEAPRSATVAALEAAETYSLFRREFDALRREHPYVNRILVAVLAASVRRMDELIVEAFYVGAEKRVLRRLRDLAAVYGNGSPTITVPLTQEDLAGLAGTSRATDSLHGGELRDRPTAAVLSGRVVFWWKDDYVARQRTSTHSPARPRNPAAATSSISGARSVNTTRPPGASRAMLRPGSPVPDAMSRCC